MTQKDHQRVNTPATISFKTDSATWQRDREWQGCPTVEITPSGKLWAGWYSGGKREPDLKNYNILAYSNDSGNTWTEYMYIRMPEGCMARAIDIQLWYTPSGSLWVTWVQVLYDESKETLEDKFFDEDMGVWAIECKNPDAPQPEWSAPRRLFDGFIRNKPTVLSNGNWLFCAYNWRDKDRYTYFISDNNGKSFTRHRGPKKVSKQTFEEHMVLERNDGSWWMLARTPEGIARSTSEDKGKSWSETINAFYANPSSRFYIGRLTSGNVIMINHVDFSGRSHLTALLSEDDGQTWQHKLLLDERIDVSYPDIVQSGNDIICLYDRERGGVGEILMTRFTEEDIKSGDFVSANSFSKRVISSVRQTKQI